MKIKEKITRWQNECRKYTQRFTKSWEYACLSGDAFINGYRCGKQAGMEELIEVEREEGEHQLSPRTFSIWNDRLNNESFKDALINQMNYWDISDLRVSVDKDGKASFQGVAKRNLSAKLFIETTG